MNFYKISAEAHLRPGLFPENKFERNAQKSLSSAIMEKKEKQLHMAEWKWVTSESFLIDQSLS